MRRLYHNGSIYTGTLPLDSCFAVEDGKFCFAGREEDAPEADVRIDLQGKFVCAGFNDSHMHLLNYGQALCMAPLHLHTGSMEDLINCLSKTPPGRGGWMMGRGWNQDYFAGEKRMPNRYDLDRVSQVNPVCAVRACGHALSVNSKALELLGKYMGMFEGSSEEEGAQNNLLEAILQATGQEVDTCDVSELQ